MSAVLEKPVAKTTKKAPTLGSVIDNLWALRETKRAKEAEVKEIELQIADAETSVYEQMDAQGVDKSTGKKASISITSVVTSSIEDWDLFTAFVKKTGYFHLLQRRVSEVAARELFESKGKVPGLTPFTKRKLNLRTVS